MVGRESEFGSVFSWADEVEKEEAAAAKEAGDGQSELQQKQKPNPFGCARPGEVVLQEKGIDWRQLDLHSSPSCTNESQNENPKKENNLYLTSKTTVLNCENPVKFRGSAPAVALSSQVISNLQIQIESPIICVPPLKYPPKYVAGVLYQPWVSSSTTLTALDSGNQDFKLDKENRYQEGRKFQSFKSESPKCGNLGRTKAQLVQAKETQQKGRNRNLGESVVYENMAEVDSISIRKEKFHGKNSMGLTLVNQNIGPPKLPDKRRPVYVWRPRNIQDEFVKNGTASQVSENNAMEWKKVTRKRQDLSVRQVNNIGGKDTGECKIKEKKAGLERTNKKPGKKQNKLKDLQLQQHGYYHEEI